MQLIDADVLRNVELYDLSLQGLIAAAARRPEAGVATDPPPGAVRSLQHRTPKGDLLLLDKYAGVTGCRLTQVGQSRGTS